jgi:hypothetical protein
MRAEGRLLMRLGKVAILDRVLRDEFAVRCGLAERRTAVS